MKIPLTSSVVAMPERALRFSIPLANEKHPLLLVTDIEPSEDGDPACARFAAFMLRRACSPEFLAALVAELTAPTIVGRRAS